MRIFLKRERIIQRNLYKPITKKEFQEIRKKIMVDAGYTPEPVIYKGEEVLKVSLLIERPCFLFKEPHPLELEFMNYSNQRAISENPHQFEFLEEVLELVKTEKKKEGNKKKEKQQNWELPNKKLTEEEEFLRRRNKSNPILTPLKEYFLKNYKSMPLYSYSDQEDNRYALNRKLRSRLYLIVKDPKTKFWKFPTMIRKDPYPLNLAAQFFFLNLCSQFEKKENQPKELCFGSILSNYPVSHYQNGNTKTFFYHFFIKDEYYSIIPLVFQSKIESKKWYDDYQWITRQELKDYEFEDDHLKKLAYETMYDGHEVTDYYE